MKLLLSISVLWGLFLATTAQIATGEELAARWHLDALAMFYDNPENLEDEASIAKYQNKIAMRFVAPADVDMVTGVYQTCPGSLKETPMAEGISVTSSVQRMGEGNMIYEEIFEITSDIVNYGADTWTEGTNDEGQKTGTAQLCYAIQLYNVGDDVVNYMQMNIAITYLLEGDFSINSFSTQSVDILLGSRNDGDRVATIESCDDNAATTYSPGDIFCVKVCSGDANFLVTEILTLNAANPDTALSQDLKGLTDQVVFSEDGKCRKAEFVLNAIFFPSGTDTNTVSIAGTCAFSFDTGRRRRFLQDVPLPTAQFKTEVTVDSGETPAPATSGVSQTARNRVLVVSMAMAVLAL